jgi:hypothetical protein
MALLTRYVVLWEIKARIARSEKESEIDDRLRKLEEAAGLAQKTEPVTR